MKSYWILWKFVELFLLITLNTEKEKPLLIVLAGPTAVGKTKLSIELAKNKNSSIFSSLDWDTNQHLHLASDRENDQVSLPD